MSEKVGEIFYNVTLETRELIEGQRRLDRELNKTSGSLDQFGAKITQVASAIGAYAAALYLIKQSDAFTKMNAQLKLATDSTRELAIAQADVKKIAQEAQADIGAVASLYAKVTSSTKELGLAQSTVAAITRTVSLSLKVSGATAAESGAAILQLGQAFASGVLRGDEFNSVNEAAPRLMKALADGIGVPVEKLREMAEQGKLTSEVLANALPKALKDLEAEAQQIQTISGAFQELKSEITLFVGEQTTANGSVRLISGAISSLADNLGLLAGVMATVAAVKFALWLESIVTQAYAQVAANRALVASNLATAQSHAVATAATSALAAARVAELRAAVLAAEGNVALAVTTNGLIPAQARAAAAAQAHAASLVALGAAQKAASASGAAVRGVIGLLGGPIGAITTLLGLGATAWMLWGNSAKDESKKAAEEVEASGREILASLEKQNAKLRERLALSKAGNVDAAKSGGKETEKLASTLAEINALKAKGAAITGSERIQLVELEGRYQDISAALAENKRLTGEISDAGQQSKATQWMEKYATDIERVNLEVAKAKKELGNAFTPEIEKRIREKIIPAKKQKRSADERFDDAGYLAGLKKNTVEAWDAIGAVENKAMLDNDFKLKSKQISYETHEKAIVLIAKAASKERQDLMEKANEDYAVEMSRANKERESLENSRASGRMVAQSTIASVNPIDAIRLEEEQRIATLEQYRQIDLGNSKLYEDAKLAVQKLASDERTRIMQNEAIQQASNNAASLGMAADLADGMYQLMEQSGAERSTLGKVLFAASKALAVAEIIMNTEVAAAKAKGQLGIYGISMETMIRATGYARAGMVASMAIAGGRQYGGPVNSGSLYRVNETGAPEMFTAGNGQQYMMPTQGGRVTAADKVGGGSVVVNVSVDASGSSAQGNSASATQLGNLIGNAVRGVLAQEKRPGGMLA